MTGLPLEIHVKEKVKQVKLQSIPNIHYIGKRRSEAFRVTEQVPLVSWWNDAIVCWLWGKKMALHNKHQTSLYWTNFANVRHITPGLIFILLSAFQKSPPKQSLMFGTSSTVFCFRHPSHNVYNTGCWHCKQVPQGFLSSGDRYNQSFDTILAEFDRKEHIVEGTIHYDRP